MNNNKILKFLKTQISIYLNKLLFNLIFKLFKKLNFQKKKMNKR
jgi:hypothetical protein